MASGFFEDISTNEYAKSLSNEIAELQEELILSTPWMSMIGKFYIPIIFPMVEHAGEAFERTIPAPSTKNIICSGFKTKNYKERNFVRIVIPEYLLSTVAQWDEDRKIWYIPKKTRFIVSFIGGSTSVGDMNIIGVVCKDLKVGNEGY